MEGISFTDTLLSVVALGVMVFVFFADLFDSAKPRNHQMYTEIIEDDEEYSDMEKIRQRWRMEQKVKKLNQQARMARKALKTMESEDF